MARTPLLNLRMSPAVMAWLDETAAQHGVTRSDLVRAAVRRVTPAEPWSDAPEHHAWGMAAAEQVLSTDPWTQHAPALGGSRGGTAVSPPDAGRGLSGGD